MRQRDLRQARRAERARHQREIESRQRPGPGGLDAPWEKLELDQRAEAARLAREFTGQVTG